MERKAVIKVLFFRDAGFFAWLIRMWTWSRFAHVELEFANGVRLRVLQRTFLTRVAPSADATLTLIVSPEQEAKAWGIAEGMVGRVYDWQGIILSQVLPVGGENRERLFCSESVAQILQAIGLLSTAKPPAWWSPARLSRHFGMEK